MLAQLNSLISLQAEWTGVIRMRERMDHLVNQTFTYDPITSPLFGNIFYNLPFQLACIVLKEVLLQGQDDAFLSRSEFPLNELLDSAQTSRPWMDWQSLREAADRHYELAHNGKLFGDKQCLQDIANIEAQLIAWGVIAAV